MLQWLDARRGANLPEATAARLFQAVDDLTDPLLIGDQDRRFVDLKDAAAKAIR
jgi:hypothetical protein